MEKIQKTTKLDKNKKLNTEKCEKESKDENEKIL